MAGFMLSASSKKSLSSIRALFYPELHENAKPRSNFGPISLARTPKSLEKKKRVEGIMILLNFELSRGGEKNGAQFY